MNGLPPTFIAVGSIDLFVDEDIDYGRRLIEVSVPVELHVYPSCFHGFNVFPTDITRQFDETLHEALRNAFAVTRG